MFGELCRAQHRLLDEDELLPFYEAVEGNNLALGVHVGWSCPSVNNLYSHIYPSGVIAFHMPVLMACTSLIAGGILDRFEAMRVVFLEAGCMWVPFMFDRMKHRFENQGELLLKFLPECVPKQALPAMDYIEKGTLFFSAEIEDSLLPQVMDLVGEGQVVIGTDMPHGDRERFAARMLGERTDISDAAKGAILDANPRRLYAL